MDSMIVVSSPPFTCSNESFDFNSRVDTPTSETSTNNEDDYTMQTTLFMRNLQKLKQEFTLTQGLNSNTKTLFNFITDFMIEL
jgi:hypothetical protein